MKRGQRAVEGQRMMMMQCCAKELPEFHKIPQGQLFSYLLAYVWIYNDCIEATLSLY